MNIISKALAPATIVMLLGTGFTPALAAGPTPSTTERVSVTASASAFTPTVDIQSEITAPINTLADAKIAAESYTGTSDIDEVVQVAEKATSNIENALAQKTADKEADAAKKAALEKAAKEKAAAEAAEAKAKKEAERKNREAAAKAAQEAKDSAAAAAAEAAETVSAEQAVAAEAATATTDRTDSTTESTTENTAPVDVLETDDFSGAPVATSGNTVTAPSNGTQKINTQGSTGETAKAPAKSKAVSSTNQKIYAAAMAQLGDKQDCTMLVTNALKSVGINFRDWPAGYKKLGKIIPASQAQPGDLIYYRDGGMGLAHIAVYAGGGKAIHGGWNGNDTVLSSANVGSGAEYIRVNG